LWLIFLMKDKIIKSISGILIALTLFTLGVDLSLFLSQYDIKFPKNFSSIKLPRAFVVLSGSMEPVIKTGGLVVVSPSDTYLKGDVVTFSQDGSKTLITHRIVNTNKKDGVTYFQTKGDANNNPDSGEIRETDIIGKTSFSIPYLGYFANFAKTPKGILLLVIIPATIIIYEEFKLLFREFAVLIKKLFKKNNLNNITSKKNAIRLPRYFMVIPVFGTALIFVAFSTSYFSDIKKSIGNYFQAASSFPVEVLLENKIPLGNWPVIEDNTYGKLIYTPSGPLFNFDFAGYGLKANTEYCLIYFADPWPGNNPGAFLGSGSTNSEGEVSISNDLNLGFNIPNPSDQNYPNWSKIWLVKCSSYDQNARMLKDWNPNDWLFETNLFKYTYTPPTPTPTPTLTPLPTNTPSPTGESITIHLNDLDANPQFGPVYDYSNADFEFTYTNPGDQKLSGIITASGLKPYATYQLKIEGTPTCQSSSGDDVLNEKIGYKGRWWNNTTNSNVDDTFYLANSVYHGGTHCITGYLVWDYITADSSGSVTKNVNTSNSYHVLWCGGGTCNSANNSQLQNISGSNPPGFPYCTSNNVNGQLERFSCGGLVLDSGVYHLRFILNEESFHQSTFGTWTAVMVNDIDFKIQ
jgi:signal peptidase